LGENFCGGSQQELVPPITPLIKRTCWQEPETVNTIATDLQGLMMVVIVSPAALGAASRRFRL